MKQVCIEKVQKSSENGSRKRIEKFKCSCNLDQVYSNTRVPTQVNTNQHESDTNQHKSNTSQHESTGARHESTGINTSPTRVNTNQHKSDTSLLDQETTIVYRSFS